MQTSNVIVEPRCISWRAVIAGAVVALSVHLLLTMLGGGITALIAQTASNEGAVKTLGIGGTVAWGVSALVSLWVGGYVAGRMAYPGDAESGRMHGFIMWSAATVVTFVLMLAGMGGAVAATAGVAGNVVSAAGKAAAEAAPDIAKETASLAGSYAGEPTAGGAPLSPRAKRQLTTALTTLFNSEESARAANRDAAVAVLTTNGVPAPEAATTVDEWLTSYGRTKAEMKAKADEAAVNARAMADRAARSAGIASICIFVAFWIGAMVSAWAGCQGALGCLDKDARKVTARPVAA